ncbi:MAG TPA: ATP-binding protein [Streptosporangiaceae bacterium]|nr:ATP-binding protein [Streptosporangiaceae bacterium]
MTDTPPAGAATASRTEAAARIWARTRPTISPRTWSLTRRLGYAFAIAAVLFAAAGVAFGLGLASTVNAVNLEVNRLDPALRFSSYLNNALINEETGVRGYALTRQRSFLQPYYAGLAAEPGDVSALRNLIAPYPALRADLNSVVDQANRWHADYAVPAINAAQLGKSVPLPQQVAGKQDFDGFREALAAFNKDATAERTAALGRLHTATDATIAEASAIGALLLLTAVVAGIALNAWVRRPLASMRREAQTVASGDLNHKVDLTGPREIMELAADVEAMRRQLILSLDDISFKASELQRSNRELEQFAYVASHDLQEPLRKVASFCQMLDSRYADQLDERARQYIAYAVDGAKRMQGLINDLLAFSRVGQPGAHFRPVDLNEVAGQAVSELEAAVEDSDATITVDRLPVITGDRTLLIQLFANLMGNSIKFRRVDVPPAIRFTAQENGGEWEFACQDNGIGIEPAYRERVFVIFQRLHPRDAYPGTGIGLALCRKIVDFHGGKIWVEDSAAGTQGTTIKWTLPTTTTRQVVADGA